MKGEVTSPDTLVFPRQVSVTPVKTLPQKQLDHMGTAHGEEGLGVRKLGFRSGVLGRLGSSGSCGLALGGWCRAVEQLPGSQF